MYGTNVFNVTKYFASARLSFYEVLDPLKAEASNI